MSLGLGVVGLFMDLRRKMSFCKLISCSNVAKQKRKQAHKEECLRRRLWRWAKALCEVIDGEPINFI